MGEIEEIEESNIKTDANMETMDGGDEEEY